MYLDSLLSRVNEVWVFLALLRVTSQTQNAVLSLHDNVIVFWNEHWRQSRNPNPQIDIRVRTDLLRGSLRDLDSSGELWICQEVLSKCLVFGVCQSLNWLYRLFSLNYSV